MHTFSRQSFSALNNHRTKVASIAAIIGLFVGQQVASQWLVMILLPLSILAVIGHFIAIMASSRVRSA